MFAGDPPRRAILFLDPPLLIRDHTRLDQECRAGAGLEAALPRNPGGVLSMSELPREVAREGRGLGASEGSQIRVSGLPRDLRFVCRGFGRLESPRLAVTTRAYRLAGRARRPDAGRASLPLLPWDGKDRVERASCSRISRWVVHLDLFSKARRRSTRATRPCHGGLCRSATRSGRRRCSRQRPHPAQASRPRASPRASRGWRGGLVRRRPRGRHGERTAG